MEPASILTWLKEPWDGPVPFDEGLPGLPESPSRLQVYAALIGIGGPPGGGYGIIISGGGPYGRTGLHQDEAHVYWILDAYIHGWMRACHDQDVPAVAKLLNEEWDRVQSLTSS